jgi:hypothetical protein
MNMYDIKHPLRGGKYENVKLKKQPFNNKIQGLMD